MKKQSLFSKILNILPKGIKEPFTSSTATLYGGQGGGFFKKKSFLDEYKNWVYACVSARAEDVANIELKLMKGDKEIFNHPVLDLINRVNPLMTKNGLFEATQSFKDLDGNAFWFLSRDKDGKGDIKEIYVIRPDKMSIVINKDNPLLIEGYVYVQSNGQKIPFSPTEILHHKNFNPTGNHPFPHKGMGVVEAAQWAIDTDNETRMFNLKFFQNSARPDGLLVSKEDGAYSPEEYRRLKSEWDEEHRGSENAHKVAILSGGIEWQEISRSQSDMQFLEQRNFNRDEILGLFRVPKTILGISQDVNLANAQAAIYVFSLKVVKPLMQKIVDTLNEFLLPQYGEDLKFVFVSPVQEDKVQKLADYKEGYNKWFTRNEIRADLGLPPTDNGDVITDNSGIEIDSISASSKAKAKTKNKKEVVNKTFTESIAKEAVSNFVSKLPKLKKGVKYLEADTKSAYIISWKKNIDTNTKPLKKKLDNYFEAQKKEVLNNLKEELKGFEAKEYKFKAISSFLFDMENEVKSAISLITPFIAQYIKDSGSRAIEIAGGDSFNDKTKTIQAFKEKRAEFFAESINETTYDALSRTIQEGIDNAESIADISKRVSDVYDIAQNSRTDMIARTEVSASNNFGAQQAYLQSGVDSVEWQVVNPEDADCLENEGVVVKIGDTFPSGVDVPPVHPNCECTTLPVFND